MKKKLKKVLTDTEKRVLLTYLIIRSGNNSRREKEEINKLENESRKL